LALRCESPSAYPYGRGYSLVIFFCKVSKLQFLDAVWRNRKIKILPCGNIVALHFHSISVAIKIRIIP